MAEITSDVYDLFHPTPIPLQDLAAMVVSLAIWRYQVNKHRRSNTLNEFRPSAKHTSLKSLLPDLPSTMYKTIEEYFIEFGCSMENWLSSHCNRDYFRYSHPNSVLQVFDDFICDYWGRIHYIKTAERMMRCDRFGAGEKFIIACNYFFEDDIRQLWPSVSRKMSLKNIYFYEFPQLYYWICYLTNRLNKIPIKENSTVDETMFDACLSYNYELSKVYFWNRMPLENRMAKAKYFFANNPEFFVRSILPKLDDQQLDEIVNKRCSFLMHTLWCGREDFALKTWFYIKNIMNESTFTKLAIIADVNRHLADDVRVRRMYVFREIWRSARPDLKRSVIGYISAVLLKVRGFIDDVDHDSIRIDVEFLLIILEFASLAERNSFWNNCWHILFPTSSVEDLLRITKLCFENEDEISRFKLNVMITSDTVRNRCVLYLRNGNFQRVNELVNFCCPEMQTARAFKQQILRIAFLSEFEIMRDAWFIHNLDNFDNFIDEAYNDVDLSADFKNQFVSSPSNQLWICVCSVSLAVSANELIRFVDTFASTEQTSSNIKMAIIDFWREVFSCRRANHDIFSDPRDSSVLSWCLGTKEEFEKFKSTFYYGVD